MSCHVSLHTIYPARIAIRWGHVPNTIYHHIYIYTYIHISENMLHPYLTLYIVKLPQFIVSLTVGPQLPSWQSLFSHGLTCQGGCLPFAPWPQLLVHLQRWAAVRIEPLVGKQRTVFAGGGCC